MFVIRASDGTQITSCHDNEINGKEVEFLNYEDAEKYLKTLKITIPFLDWTIEKIK